MDFREILAESDLAVWEEITIKLVSNYDIKVIQAPETCLVMMPVRDSVEQSPFYLGEVLITEAVVEIKGTPGHGFALEDNPERALTYALIDAALAQGLPEAGEIRALLARQEQEIKNQRQKEKNLIASTRVNFAVLEG